MTVLTQVVSRLLLAPVLAVAVAVLVKGYGGPGDGFAAGVIAALGVLLQYVAFGRDAVRAVLPVRHARTLTFAGLGLAVVIAFVPLAFGDPVLTHRPAAGTDPIYLGTLELITAFAFDVAIFVLVLGAVLTVLDAIAGSQLERERA